MTIVRVPFCNVVTTDTFIESFAPLPFTLLNDRSTADARMVEWKSEARLARMTLHRFHDLEDLGCLLFEGEESVALAFDVASWVNYWPVALVHEHAVHSPRAELRAAMIRVLGALHLSDDGSGWTPALGTALERASGDDAAIVRLAVVVAASLSRSSAGRRLLSEKSLHDAARTVREIASKILQDFPAELPDSPVNGPVPAATTTPVLLTGSAEDDLSRFQADHFSVSRTGVDPITAIVRRLDRPDVEMRYVADEDRAAGAMFFRAPEPAARAELAAACAQASHMLPPELAEPASHNGSDREARERATRGLELAQSLLDSD